MPALRGQALPERPIYFESLEPFFNRGWAPIKGIIDGRIKYIDSSPPELYDLEIDFSETENLSPDERKQLGELIRMCLRR